jgi:hypothetical protein
MISYSWAGSQQKYFNETLAKLYPDSYMFFTWDNTIRFWGNKLTLKKVTESKKPIYLYLENDAPELYQKTLEKFEFTKDSCSVDSTLLFKNKNTKELIYRLNFYTRNVEAIKTK